jgi:hypothetical protein
LKRSIKFGELSPECFLNCITMLIKLFQTMLPTTHEAYHVELCYGQPRKSMSKYVCDPSMFFRPF